MMTAQAQSTVSVTENLAGSFHRIDAAVPDSWSTMDTTKRVDEFIASGRSEAVKKQNVNVASTVFLNGQMAEPFKPLH